MVYFKKNQEEYEMLQSSRCGMDSHTTKSLDSFLEEAKVKILEVKESDSIRFSEITGFLNKEGLDLSSVAELGFRIPIVLKQFKDIGYKTIGFDVLESNIIVGNGLGFESKIYDFNDCKEDLYLNDFDLVVSYHMFEHLSDPQKALNKVFKSMKIGAYFHIEVPIEPGIPNIRYCHMFPFHSRDLNFMLKDAGFSVISGTNKTHAGGPNIERYIALKE